MRRHDSASHGLRKEKCMIDCMTIDFLCRAFEMLQINSNNLMTADDKKDYC